MSKTYLLIGLIFFGSLAACSEAKFHGSAPSRATNQPETGDDGTTPGDDGTDGTPPTTDGGTDGTPPTDGGTDGTPPTDGGTDGTPPAGDDGDEGTSTDGGDDTTPPCEDTEQAIGAEIAFIIDNSKSNEETDCPGYFADGEREGLKRYTCSEKTNRENAVMAAYDLLEAVAAKEPENPLARSRLAIASFPTEDDGKTGWSKRLDWLDVAADQRSSVASSMIFARRTWGHTPYNSAMTAATSLFAGVEAGERAQVVVLVTDGEATDSRLQPVLDKAASLRASGVKVFTIFYNGGVSTEKRAQAHTTMMREFDEVSLKHKRQHWFDESEFADLDAYIAAILGGNGEPSLIKKISTDEQVVEVDNAGQLKEAFLRIIKTKAIRCEQ